MVGNQQQKVLDQMRGTGPRGGMSIVEREGEAKPRTSVCRGSGRAWELGSPYLMASVFSVTGWHLLSQRARGWVLRRLMKIQKL